MGAPFAYSVRAKSHTSSESGEGRGQIYGFRAHGPFDPSKGYRFDSGKVLLDPYGRGVVVPNGYNRAAARDKGDNASTAMKSVVVDPDAYDWEGDRPLQRPSSQTIVYEMHVRGFTKNPNSGLSEATRGTYAGLIKKIPYLQELGVTAVELLPVFQFDPLACPAGVVNYWGYQPVSYFAPARSSNSCAGRTSPMTRWSWYGNGFRMRNSVLAEALLVAVVYLVGVTLVWRHFVALSTTATWYSTPTADGLKVSPTGWWYVCVSLPVFQFLLIRWYYRILIWVRFLWARVTHRIESDSDPPGPRRGLGFLALVSFAFAPLAVAHGDLLAGLIANRIFYLKAALPDFKAEIAAVVSFSCVWCWVRS